MGDLHRILDLGVVGAPRRFRHSASRALQRHSIKDAALAFSDEEAVMNDNTEGSMGNRCSVSIGPDPITGRAKAIAGLSFRLNSRGPLIALLTGKLEELTRPEATRLPSKDSPNCFGQPHHWSV